MTRALHRLDDDFFLKILERRVIGKNGKIWNKIADIATLIFVVGFALIVILAIIGTIGAFVIGAWFFLWNWNKFVFGIYLIFLICGAITAINWLIFNIKN